MAEDVGADLFTGGHVMMWQSAKREDCYILSSTLTISSTNTSLSIRIADVLPKF